MELSFVEENDEQIRRKKKQKQLDLKFHFIKASCDQHIIQNKSTLLSFLNDCLDKHIINIPFLLNSLINIQNLNSTCLLLKMLWSLTNA